MLQSNYYYNKSDSLHKAYADSYDAINDLVVFFSAALNKIHSTNHSLRYWKILLLPWLRLLVENYHHIYLTSDSHADKAQKGSGLLVPLDYDHFIKMIVEEGYRYSLRNQLDVIDDVSLKSARYTIKGYKNGTNRYSIILKKWVYHSVSFMTRAGSFLFHKRIVVSLDYFDPKLYYLLFKRGVYPVLFRLDNGRRRGAAPVDGGLRESLFHLGLKYGCGQENRRLWKLVCATIPLSYLESHKDLEDSIGAGIMPAAILTKNVHSNDRSKQWMASVVEKGGKLIVAQHGGGFGIVYHDYSEQIEIQNSDLYLSFYSSSQNGVKQIPADKFIPYDLNSAMDRMLLINTVYPSFYKYHSCPINEQFHQNIHDQIRFIDSLDESIRCTLSVRQYPNSYDMPVKELYQQSGYDVYEDNDQDFYSLIKGSRLVVLSYMGTTWLETLMNNIPTVVFVNPEHWKVRDSVLPFIDQLRQVGILHDTPQSAALHVNNIGNKIQSWWFSSELQDVRRGFCKNYAYTDKRWRNVWVDAIVDESKKPLCTEIDMDDV